MDNNLQTLDTVKDSLKAIHNQIVNDIFYSDNDLFASKEVDEQFLKIINSINQYESIVNEYTAKQYVSDNLFGYEMLKQFDIKDE
jgi:hypothetical protein